MKSEPGVRARARGFFTLSLFSIIVASAFAFIPANASAAEISVKTTQVVPGTGTCTQPTASAFKAYEYDGSVDSFDIDISDPAYVAVAGTVGDMNVPFPQMNRRITPAGALHIHTDIESTPLARSMPISIILLSAKPGAPICLTQVTVTATAAEQAAFEQIPQPAPISYGTPQKKPATPVGKATVEKKEATSSMAAASATVTQTFGRIKDTLQQNACGTRNGTSRLWFIFLVLYVLALGAIALSRPPTTRPYPLAWLISAILIPVFLLVSFWYVLSVCGVSRWIPIVAVVAGLAGIAIALRGSAGDDDSESMLLLKQETPTGNGSVFMAPAAAAPVEKQPATTPANLPTAPAPAPAQPKLPVETKEPEKPVIITPPPAKPQPVTSTTTSAAAPEKEPAKPEQKGSGRPDAPQPPKMQ